MDNTDPTKQTPVDIGIDLGVPTGAPDVDVDFDTGASTAGALDPGPKPPLPTYTPDQIRDIAMDEAALGVMRPEDLEKWIGTAAGAHYTKLALEQAARIDNENTLRSMKLVSRRAEDPSNPFVGYARIPAVLEDGTSNPDAEVGGFKGLFGESHRDVYLPYTADESPEEVIAEYRETKRFFDEHAALITTAKAADEGLLGTPDAISGFRNELRSYADGADWLSETGDATAMGLNLAGMMFGKVPLGVLARNAATKAELRASGLISHTGRSLAARVLTKAAREKIGQAASREAGSIVVQSLGDDVVRASSPTFYDWLAKRVGRQGIESLKPGTRTSVERVLTRIEAAGGRLVESGKGGVDIIAPKNFPPELQNELRHVFQNAAAELGDQFAGKIGVRFARWTAGEVAAEKAAFGADIAASVANKAIDPEAVTPFDNLPAYLEQNALFTGGGVLLEGAVRGLTGVRSSYRTFRDVGRVMGDLSEMPDVARVRGPKGRTGLTGQQAVVHADVSYQWPSKNAWKENPAEAAASQAAKAHTLINGNPSAVLGELRASKLGGVGETDPVTVPVLYDEGRIMALVPDAEVHGQVIAVDISESMVPAQLPLAGEYKFHQNHWSPFDMKMVDDHLRIDWEKTADGVGHTAQVRELYLDEVRQKAGVFLDQANEPQQIARTVRDTQLETEEQRRALRKRVDRARQRHAQILPTLDDAEKLVRGRVGKPGARTILAQYRDLMDARTAQLDLLRDADTYLSLKKLKPREPGQPVREGFYSRVGKAIEWAFDRGRRVAEGEQTLARLGDEPIGKTVNKFLAKYAKEQGLDKKTFGALRREIGLLSAKGDSPELQGRLAELEGWDDYTLQRKTALEQEQEKLRKQIDEIRANPVRVKANELFDLMRKAPEGFDSAELEEYYAFLDWVEAQGARELEVDEVAAAFQESQWHYQEQVRRGSDSEYLGEGSSLFYDPDRKVSMSPFWLANGTNRREFLFWRPQAASDQASRSMSRFDTAEDLERNRFREARTEFTPSGHFGGAPEGGSDLAFWVRTSDHVTPDGQRVLVIEEMQSDWSKRTRFQGGPGGVPFGEAWIQFGLRRMLHEAVTNGYDRVAWTPGMVQRLRNNTVLQKVKTGSIEFKGRELVFSLETLPAVLDGTDIGPSQLELIQDSHTMSAVRTGAAKKSMTKLLGEPLTEKILEWVDEVSTGMGIVPKIEEANGATVYDDGRVVRATSEFGGRYFEILEDPATGRHHVEHYTMLTSPHLDGKVDPDTRDMLGMEEGFPDRKAAEAALARFINETGRTRFAWSPDADGITHGGEWTYNQYGDRLEDLQKDFPARAAAMREQIPEGAIPSFLRKYVVDQKKWADGFEDIEYPDLGPYRVVPVERYADPDVPDPRDRDLGPDDPDDPEAALWELDDADLWAPDNEDFSILYDPAGARPEDLLWAIVDTRGGGADDSSIVTGGYTREEATRIARDYADAEGMGSYTFQSIPVTERLKQAILNEGQALGIRPGAYKSAGDIDARRHAKGLERARKGLGFSKHPIEFARLSHAEKVDAMRARLGWGPLKQVGNKPIFNSPNWQRLNPRNWYDASGKLTKVPKYFGDWKPTVDEVAELERIYTLRDQQFRAEHKTVGALHRMVRNGDYEGQLTWEDLLAVDEAKVDEWFRTDPEMAEAWARSFWSTRDRFLDDATPLTRTTKEQLEQAEIEQAHQALEYLEEVATRYFDDAPLWRGTDIPDDLANARQATATQAGDASARMLGERLYRPFNAIGPRSQLPHTREWKKAVDAGVLDRDLYTILERSVRSLNNADADILGEFEVLERVAAKDPELSGMIFRALDTGMPVEQLKAWDDRNAKTHFVGVRPVRIKLAEWVPKLRKFYDKIIDEAQGPLIEKEAETAAELYAAASQYETEINRRILRKLQADGNKARKFKDLSPAEVKAATEYLRKNDMGAGPGTTTGHKSFQTLERIFESRMKRRAEILEKIEKLKEGNLHRDNYVTYLHRFTAEQIDTLLRNEGDPMMAWLASRNPDLRNNFLKQRAGSNVPLEDWAAGFRMYVRAMHRTIHLEPALRTVHRMANKPGYAENQRQYAMDVVSNLKGNSQPLDRMIDAAAKDHVMHNRTVRQQLFDVLRRATDKKTVEEALKEYGTLGIPSSPSKEFQRRWLPVIYSFFLRPEVVAGLNIFEQAWSIGELAKHAPDLMPATGLGRAVAPGRFTRKGAFTPSKQWFGNTFGAPAWLATGAITGTSRLLAEGASAASSKIFGTRRWLSEPRRMGVLDLVHDAQTPIATMVNDAKTAHSGTVSTRINARLADYYLKIVTWTDQLTRAWMYSTFKQRGLAHGLDPKDAMEEAANRTSDVLSAFGGLGQSPTMSGMQWRFAAIFQKFVLGKVGLAGTAGYSIMDALKPGSSTRHGAGRAGTMDRRNKVVDVREMDRAQMTPEERMAFERMSVMPAETGMAYQMPRMAGLRNAGWMMGQAGGLVGSYYLAQPMFEAMGFDSESLWDKMEPFMLADGMASIANSLISDFTRVVAGTKDIAAGAATGDKNIGLDAKEERLYYQSLARLGGLVAATRVPGLAIPLGMYTRAAGKKQRRRKKPKKPRTRGPRGPGG